MGSCLWCMLPWAFRLCKPGKTLIPTFMSFSPGIKAQQTKPKPPCLPPLMLLQYTDETAIYLSLCYVQIPLGTFDVHAKSIKRHANQHLARLGTCMLSKVCWWSEAHCGLDECALIQTIKWLQLFQHLFFFLKYFSFMFSHANYNPSLSTKYKILIFLIMNLTFVELPFNIWISYDHQYIYNNLPILICSLLTKFKIPFMNIKERH
jgi:hypothetical protein